MRADVLVLCYHAVSDTWPADLSVRPAALEEQVTSLLKTGYEPVTFSEAVSSSRRRLLAVTFDDAFASVLEYAKPILDRLRVPGTVFVVTKFAEGCSALCWEGIEHWSKGPHAHELRALRWEELQKLANDGWEIGSHTCNHPHLTTCSDEELVRQLVESRAACERALQRPCTSIAYPYGDTNDRVETAAARAGYMYGAALPSHWHQPQRMRWPRVGIYRFDKIWRFRLKTSWSIRQMRLAAERLFPRA